MAKLLSIALVVALVWFIIANVRDIVAKVKANKAEKEEKERDTAESKSEEREQA